MSRVLSWRPGKLAKGTIRLTAGMGLRSLAQALIFLVAARVLGVSTYGAFAAVLALAGMIGGLTGCGTQNLLSRDTARDARNFPLAWGTTLVAIALSAPVLFLCYYALAARVLPDEISSITILLLGLTELTLTPLGLATIAAYHGHERIGRAARLVLTPVVFRLCGALAFVPVSLNLSTELHLDTWAAFYVSSTLLAAVYAFALVRRDLGHPAWPEWSTLGSSLLAAWPFGLGILATRLYSDIDKVMLSQLADLEATGTYSAAYRIVELACIPIVSLLTAAMPTMFRKGESSDTRELIDYSLRIARIPLTYAASAGIAMYLLAGFAPLLLGGTFSDTVFALQWLAWLPLLSFGRLLLQRQMLGTDRQKVVAFVLGGGGVLNILINMQLIPLLGWRGAVLSTYIAEASMTLIMGWLILRSRKQEMR